MAASSGDVQALVTKLRGKGLDDAAVTESLRGMGYSKAEAVAAVGAGETGSGTAPKATKKPGRSPGGRRTGAKGGGGTETAPAGLPSLSMPSLPSVPTPTLKPPRRLGSGDVAGFAVGLLAYTLALNYLRSGPAGVTGWLSAKFLNKITLPPPGLSGPITGSGSSGLTSTKPTVREV